MRPDLPERIASVYRELDAGTAAFQAASGLSCPPGCGACCTAPTVEAGVLEMLPAARELLRRGEAEAWRSKAASAGGEERCVFYEPEAGDALRGRCGIYSWRPVVCRLFGFAGSRNKHGAVELVVCPTLREASPQGIARARDAVAAGVPIPVFADARLRVSGIEPGAGADRLAINDALARALDSVLHRAAYEV